MARPLLSIAAPIAAGVIACSLSMGTARAQGASSFLDTVRLGVFAHDIDGFEPGEQINGEVQFKSPFETAWGDSLPSWIAWLTRPRPMLGADINTAGATSEGYVGLTWTVLRTGHILSGVDDIFVDVGFAPAFNGGYTNITSTTHKSLGSNVLFRSDAEIGYDITQQFSISVLIDHSSNAGLGKKNPGYNDLGVRLGFRF